MKWFLQTSAGKGTVCVCLVALLLAWPPAGSWLMAVIALILASEHLRDSFRKLDAEEAAARKAAKAAMAEAEAAALKASTLPPLGQRQTVPAPVVAASTNGTGWYS
jgi:hypothetical protein